MLWMMRQMKPKGAVRVAFFHAQRFDSGYYFHCYCFDHFSIHLDYSVFDYSLFGIAGYSLVFSKWYSSINLENNKKNQLVNASSWFTRVEKFFKAVLTGSEEVISTPAPFNRSIGYLEPPPFRKFK